MAAKELRGKAQTVLGLIGEDQLGFTLPHEHFFIDVRNYFVEPGDPGDKKLADEPIPAILATIFSFK